MYETHINNLTALFKGKREKAVRYLSEEIKNNPGAVTMKLLKAPDKAWPYVQEILRANPEGVFLYILRHSSDEKAEKVINAIGRSSYIRDMREFKSLRKEVEGYKEIGIGLDYKEQEDAYYSGDIHRAVLGMREILERGRKLKNLLDKWKELESLAKSGREIIPDIKDAITEGNLDKAEKILNSIDERHLRERAEFMDKYREVSRILKHIEWVEGGKELRDELKRAKSIQDIEKVMEKINALVAKVYGIRSIRDDYEIREIMKRSMIEAREFALLKKRAIAIAKELGWEYEKKISEDVLSNLPEVLREYISRNIFIESEEVKKLFDRALEVAEGIKDAEEKAEALLNIASELAKVDVDRALMVAEGIKDAEEKAEALLNIASELAKVDVDRGKEIFDRAIRVAEGIEGVLSDIASELAKVDVERALRVAEGIGDKADALLNIAPELAKVDVDRAIRVAEGIEYARWKADALRDIAGELAKVDVDRALRVAEGIEDESWKASALSNIASELTKANPEMAKEIFDRVIRVAEGIENAFWRAEALRNMASELAKVNSERAKEVLDRAIRVAEGIEYARWKADALRDIAGELAKVDVDRALRVAEGIEDESWKASALSSIASELTKANPEMAKEIFDRAIRVAEGIWDAFSKAWALRNIASELAKTETKKLLRNISDEQLLELFRKSDEFLKDAGEIVRTLLKLKEEKKAYEKVKSLMESIESEFSYPMEGYRKELESVSGRFDIQKLRKTENELEEIASRLENISLKYREIEELCEKTGEEMPEIAPYLQKGHLDGVENLLSQTESMLREKFILFEKLKKARSSAVSLLQALVFSGYVPLLEAMEWAESAGIEINIEDMREHSSKNNYEKDTLSEKIIRNISSKKEEYEDMQGEWNRLKRDYGGYIQEMDVMPKKYSELKSSLKMLRKRVESMESIKEKYEELKSLAEKAGEEIPDISPYLKENDLKGAEKIIAGIDKERLKVVPEWKKRKKKIREEFSSVSEEFDYPVDSLLAELEKIPKGENFEMLETLEKKASALREELKTKREKYEALLKEWDELADKMRGVGADIPEKPEDSENLEQSVEDLKKLMEDSAPELSMDFEGELIENRWGRVILKIQNKGNVIAENIRMEIKSRVIESEEIDPIPVLKPGKSREIRARMKSKDAGEVPVIFILHYMDRLSGEEKEIRISPDISVNEKTAVGRVERRAENISEMKIKPDINRLGKKYDVIEEVGNGSFGIVYKVKRKSDGKIVAVKIPKRWDEESSIQFMDEVTIWQELQHKNRNYIVNVFKKSASPFGYIEMEYMERSLDDLKFPLDPKVASEYMLSVAYALYNAHSQRPPVIHMDIKPSNILIDSHKRAKLGDWGLAGRKYKDSELSGGSIDFCSPEVLDITGSRGRVDEQSDMFGFGSTFYYILTGVKPFSGRNREETVKNILSRDYIPKRPSEVNLKVPEILDGLVMKCIEKDKSGRFANFSEIIYLLCQYLQKKPDLTTGGSTVLGTELAIYEIKNPNKNMKEKKAVMLALKDHSKTERIRKEIESIIEVMDEYIEGEIYEISDELMERMEYVVKMVKKGL